MDSQEPQFSLTDAYDAARNYQAHFDTATDLQNLLVGEFDATIMTAEEGKRSKMFEMLVHKWKTAYLNPNDQKLLVGVAAALKIRLSVGEVEGETEIDQPAASCGEGRDAAQPEREQDPTPSEDDPLPHRVSWRDTPGDVLEILDHMMNLISKLGNRVETLEKTKEDLTRRVKYLESRGEVGVGEAIGRMDRRIVTLESTKATPRTSPTAEKIAPPVGASCPPPKKKAGPRTRDNEIAFALTLKDENKYKIRKMVRAFYHAPTEKSLNFMVEKCMADLKENQ